ncbi:MAG: hypothetical protein ACREI3_00775 [Nitrospirales bacterium]
MSSLTTPDSPPIPRSHRPVWLLILLGAWLGACVGPRTPAPEQAITPPPFEERYVLELEVGHRYPAGTRLRVPLFGLSFVLPEAWEGRLAPGSEFLLLQSEGRQGVGIVLFLLDVTLEELAQRLETPQTFGHGMAFMPTGPVHESGGLLAASYSSENLVGRATAVKGPSGQGLIVFLAGSTGLGEAFEQAGEALATSTRFFPVETTRAEQRWREYVSGMRIAVILPVTNAHAGRVAVRSVWDLCPGGTYRARHEPVLTVEAPGGSEFLGQGTVEAGRWRVEVGGLEAWVIFEEPGGRVTRYALEYDGEGLLVDGTRASRGVSPDCR